MNWVLIGWGACGFAVLALFWLEERSFKRQEAQDAESLEVMALEELWSAPAHGEWRGWA